VRLAFVLIAAGLAVYLLRARVRREWPFAKEVSRFSF
jgi:hypothetical protein